MFCYIEQVEIRSPTCPAKKCIYKNAALQCGYVDLTPDLDQGQAEIAVTAVQIAKTKGQKLYKVKSDQADARERIRIGVALLKYVEFINGVGDPAVLRKPRTDTPAEEIKEGGQSEGYPGYVPDLSVVEKLSQRFQVDDPLWKARVEKVLLVDLGLDEPKRLMFFDRQLFRQWREGAGLEFPLTLAAAIDAIRRATLIPITQQKR